VTTPTIYSSTDTDAPALTGEAGSLVTVLRSCLVDGYGSGGNIRTPLGWETVATATNKIAVRSADTNSTQCVLRVDDTGTATGLTYGVQTAVLRGYETMSDVDTGSNPFPTVAQENDYSSLLRKSNTYDSTARPWEMIGDAAGFYFLCLNSRTDLTVSSGEFACIWFGDLGPPTLPGDMSNCLLAVEDDEFIDGFSSSVGRNSSLTSHNRAYMPRAFDQVPHLISASKAAAWPTWNDQFMGKAGVSYPHPADGKLWVTGLQEVYEGDSSFVLRGTMPGLYNPMHPRPLGSREDRTVFGRTLRAYLVGEGSTARQIMIDTTGPWRE
jgi:hypothetical protein